MPAYPTRSARHHVHGAQWDGVSSSAADRPRPGPCGRPRATELRASRRALSSWDEIGLLASRGGARPHEGPPSHRRLRAADSGAPSSTIARGAACMSAGEKMHARVYLPRRAQMTARILRAFRCLRPSHPSGGATRPVWSAGGPSHPGRRRPQVRLAPARWPSHQMSG